MDKKHCRGCENDFYNGHNDMGIKECWSLKSAKLVTRFEIGTWTQPMQPGAFTEVRLPNCYHRKGSSFYTKEQLPDGVEPVTRKNPAQS